MHAVAARKAVVAAVFLTSPLAAQAPARQLVTLKPASTNTSAVAELQAAIADYQSGSVTSEMEHLRKALEMEPQLGLARALAARWRGGPTAQLEMGRAATDAATASAGEAVLVLAYREFAAGRAPNGRKLLAAAADLMPDDPMPALDYANSLADTSRINALRAVTRKWPAYAPAHQWLAYTLSVPVNFNMVSGAQADEALREVAEAERLAPEVAGVHAFSGWVHHNLGHEAQALAHYDKANSISPLDWVYNLKAEIASRNGQQVQVRAFLDSGVAVSTAVSNQFAYRIERAYSWLADGNAKQAMTDLSALLTEATELKATGQVNNIHAAMALLSAATRDAAAVAAHVGEAKKGGAGAGAIADNEVIAYSLAGNASEARRALGDYIQLQQSNTNTVVRDENIHRMTGMVLMAENKCAEAIPELRQGGGNPYATVGIVECLKMQGKKKDADAERSAFLAKKNFSIASSAVPIMRYRAKM